MIDVYYWPTPNAWKVTIMLEECGLEYQVHEVNIGVGDQFKPDYLATNPKATIPVLIRDDGSALTEFQAIAWWLARQHPKAGLLPDSIEGETRVIETMDYVVGTIHGQGYTRIFTTSNYTSNEAEHAAIQAHGKTIVESGFAVMNEILAEREYVVGNFSIADAALFYVEFWADKIQLELPPHCERHYQRMLQRPKVRQVLAEEGYRV